MDRLTVIAGVVAAAVVGAAVFYQNRVDSDDEARLTTPDNSDYYMDDATVYQLNKQGQLAYRLKAARSLHFPNDSARFNDIHVHYLTGTDTYWNLAAAKGRIPPGQRDLYLYDGVTGQHPSDRRGMIHIKTDHAWVRPDSDRVESDAKVKAVQPGQVLEGTGMRINLKTNKLDILNDAHVTYTQ